MEVRKCCCPIHTMGHISEDVLNDEGAHAKNERIGGEICAARTEGIHCFLRSRTPSKVDVRALARNGCYTTEAFTICDTCSF